MTTKTHQNAIKYTILAKIPNDHKILKNCPFQGHIGIFGMQIHHPATLVYTYLCRGCLQKNVTVVNTLYTRIVRQLMDTAMYVNR
jgi:hypothetical protein